MTTTATTRHRTVVDARHSSGRHRVMQLSSPPRCQAEWILNFFFGGAEESRLIKNFFKNDQRCSRQPGRE